MAGGISNPNPNWMRQFIESFPEWAAQQGVEPPAGPARSFGSLIPIDTIGQPPGTPRMNNGQYDVTRDAGSAIGRQTGPNVPDKDRTSRVIGTEQIAGGQGDLPRGLPGMPVPPTMLSPFNKAQIPYHPASVDALPFVGPQPLPEETPTPPQVDPQVAQTGVPAPAPVPQDVIPPPMDPVTQMPGTPPTAEATSNPLGSALGLIELMAPPNLPTPAAPAPPPIRPVDSKLMEVLGMGLRPGSANAGMLSPFLGLLGKG